MGVVGGGLLEGAVGEGGQGVEPGVCGDGAAGDAHLLEEGGEELVAKVKDTLEGYREGKGVFVFGKT